ncbi:transporter [Desulfonema ishimotonii]|uniref:Probable queuosine precursor transporter n=1 Tax=Desulfonema ishimotonii TaxID=45657 RepID=A0A401G203_9BACT|nr:queuosine precursor transporter [Desulfonema ishimotonii]GBC63258.1 transporter [Desulfonema ishimotonii]
MTDISNFPDTPGKSEKEYSKWFVLTAVTFVTCLITANIIAVKLINIAGLILPAAVIIFPVSYIVGDVLTEVYGYKQARQVIWLGFFCNILAVAAIWAGGLLPAAAFWDGQAAYERILGFAPRLLMASFIAYLIGEFANACVLAKMKILTGGKWLWTRTIGSTLVGQGLDSVVFVFVAFSGVIPLEGMISAIITQWLFKSCYEAAATPFTYMVVGFLKRREGVDVYDRDTQFNPFLMAE